MAWAWAVAAWAVAVAVGGHVAWASAGVWTPSLSLPVARSDATVDAWNGRLYIAGGCDGPQDCVDGYCSCTSYTDDFVAYDPVADNYTALPLMPVPRYRHASALWDDAIYYIGGRQLANDSVIVLQVDRFNLTTATWTTMQPAPAVLTSDNTAFVIGDAIYVAGGYNIDYSVSSNGVLRYFPGNDTWDTTAVARMAFGRGDVASAVVGGLAYVYGGYQASDYCQPVAYVEMYNPANNSWTQRADLPQALAEKDDGVVLNGLVYAIGGETTTVLTNCDDLNIVPLRQVYAFNPAQNAWANVTVLPDAHFRFGAAALDGLIYVVGGQGPLWDGEAFPLYYSVYTYSPSAGTTETETATTGCSSGAIAGAVLGSILGALVAAVAAYFVGFRHGQLAAVRLKETASGPTAST